MVFCSEHDLQKWWVFHIELFFYRGRSCRQLQRADWLAACTKHFFPSRVLEKRTRIRTSQFLSPNIHQYSILLDTKRIQWVNNTTKKGNIWKLFLFLFLSYPTNGVAFWFFTQHRSSHGMQSPWTSHWTQILAKSLICLVGWNIRCSPPPHS